MKAFFCLLTVLGSIFILSSCYNKEFNEPGMISIDKQPTQRLMPSRFDRVWAATQRVFTKFPVKEKRADTASGQAYLVTDWIRGKSDILYSGYGDNRMPYTIRYKLYVYLVPGKGGTEVKVSSVEQYREDSVTAGVDFDGSIFTWIRTDSSTLKEARILDEVDKLVRDASFNP